MSGCWAVTGRVGRVCFFFIKLFALLLRAAQSAPCVRDLVNSVHLALTRIRSTTPRRVLMQPSVRRDTTRCIPALRKPLKYIGFSLKRIETNTLGTYNCGNITMES